jgi:hypothetical protein
MNRTHKRESICLFIYQSTYIGYSDVAALRSSLLPLRSSILQSNGISNRLFFSPPFSMGLALIYRLQVVEGWIENHGFDRILWAYPDPLSMVLTRSTHISNDLR